MKFSHIIQLILFVLIGNFAHAQFNETIVTGRPGQSNGPFGVGKGIYQVQSGIDFNDVSSDFGMRESEAKSWNHNSIFRIGLFEKTEFRVGYGYALKETFSSNITSEFAEEQSGFSTFQLGLRQHLLKQYGIIPAIGFQVTAKFGGLDRYQRDKFNYEGKLIMQHRFSDNLILNSNFSIEYNDEIDYTFGRYVFSFGYSLTDRLVMVVEAYGTVDDVDTQVFFDGGLGYRLSDNLQLDLYGGYGQNTLSEFDVEVKAYFISAGVSFRINTRD